MAKIRERPNSFFRLSPVERSEASCFGILRSDITGRFDVNYWRLTPLVKQRLSSPQYSVASIGQAVEYIQYGISSLAKTEPPGTPIIRMNNLQNDGWNFSELKYIELTDTELDTYRLMPGDILFNRTNSKELVGKCEVFKEKGDWVFASYLIRVRTHQSRLNPQFASDFLGTSIGRLQIDRLSRQIIGMTNINAEEIRELQIPLPDVGKQVEFVKAMNIARSERQHRIAKADEIVLSINDYILEAIGAAPPLPESKKVYAIRRNMLNRRIDAYSNQPHFRELFRCTCNSKMRHTTFSEIAERIFSGSTPLAKSDAYVEPPSGVRFIRSGEITPEGGITKTSQVHVSSTVHESTLKGSQLRKGDILIAIVGATIGSVGVYDDDAPANINQAIASVRLRQAEIRPEYACLYMQSSFGQQFLDYFKRPVARANINLGEVGEIPIIIPPTSIQDEIISEVKRRRAEAQKLQNEAEVNWDEAKRRFEDQLLG